MNKPYQSSIYISTKDAYTLTDGPTIYLADDVEKIARFCYQQAKFPETIISDIKETILRNEKIVHDVSRLEKNFEDAMSKFAEKEKKMSDEGRYPPEVKQLKRKIEDLQNKIKSISLPSKYIINSKSHLDKWCVYENIKNIPYKSDISEENVIKLMQLQDIEVIWKILLLMGIGCYLWNKLSILSWIHRKRLVKFNTRKNNSSIRKSW